MPAQTFVLTQTPTKILDGTKAGYVQEIINTGTRFTVSASTTTIRLVRGKARKIL